MFIAIHDGHGHSDITCVGKGLTLKAAFDDVKAAVEKEGLEFDQDAIEFFESTQVDVEFQIVKKEVVTKVTAKKSQPKIIL